jgi:hypothetical protein
MVGLSPVEAAKVYVRRNAEKSHKKEVDLSDWAERHRERYLRSLPQITPDEVERVVYPLVVSKAAASSAYKRSEPLFWAPCFPDLKSRLKTAKELREAKRNYYSYLDELEETYPYSAPLDSASRYLLGALDERNDGLAGMIEGVESRDEVKVAASYLRANEARAKIDKAIEAISRSLIRPARPSPRSSPLTRGSTSFAPSSGASVGSSMLRTSSAATVASMPPVGSPGS